MPVTTAGGAIYGVIAGQSANNLATLKTAMANAQEEIVFHDALADAAIKACLAKPDRRLHLGIDRTCPEVVSALTTVVTDYELIGPKAVNPSDAACSDESDLDVRRRGRNRRRIL